MATSTANTINIGSGTSIISFFVTSDPENPTFGFSSPNEFVDIGNPSWSKNQVRIPSNTGDSRTATLTITATTTSNTEYNGVASATSSYTINQQAAAQFWQFNYKGPQMNISNNTSNQIIVHVEIDIEAGKLYEGNYIIGDNRTTVYSYQSRLAEEFPLKTCQIKYEYDNVDITIYIYNSGQRYNYSKFTIIRNTNRWFSHNVKKNN